MAKQRSVPSVVGLVVLVGGLSGCDLLKSWFGPKQIDETSTPGSLLNKVKTTPMCERVGSPEEGWYLDGVLLKQMPCEGKFIGCEKPAGGGAEGWYAYERKNPHPVRYDECAQKRPPICVRSGKDKDGWQGESWFDAQKCMNSVISCDAVGTRAEGWYAYEKANPVYLKSERCPVDEVPPAP